MKILLLEYQRHQPGEELFRFSQASSVLVGGCTSYQHTHSLPLFCFPPREHRCPLFKIYCIALKCYVLWYIFMYSTPFHLRNFSYFLGGNLKSSWFVHMSGLFLTFCISYCFLQLVLHPGSILLRPAGGSYYVIDINTYSQMFLSFQTVHFYLENSVCAYMHIFICSFWIHKRDSCIVVVQSKLRSALVEYNIWHNIQAVVSRSVSSVESMASHDSF